MKVYAPRDLYLVPVGHAVAKGEAVEVSEEVGASLVEQGWRKTPPKAVARKKAAAHPVKSTPSAPVEPEPNTPEPEAVPAADTKENI